jgi:hypothetical protein
MKESFYYPKDELNSLTDSKVSIQQCVQFQIIAYVYFYELIHVHNNLSFHLPIIHLCKISILFAIHFDNV